MDCGPFHSDNLGYVVSERQELCLQPKKQKVKQKSKKSDEDPPVPPPPAGTSLCCMMKHSDCVSVIHQRNANQKGQ